MVELLFLYFLHGLQQRADIAASQLDTRRNSQKKDDSSPTKIEVSIANVDEFISYLRKNNVKVIDDWVIENIIRSFKFKIKTKVIS